MAGCAAGGRSAPGTAWCAGEGRCPAARAPENGRERAGAGAGEGQVGDRGTVAVLDRSRGACI